MEKRPKKTQKSASKLREFVTLILAEDMEQAREYESLLKVNDVACVLREQNEQTESASGIAVMVPEEFLDEANVIIESQNVYDDFYDFVAEQEDDNFDDEFFDDEFE
ncbi:MAG: DUF2007 domain-containing protein [Planctomycetes bacterium]|nr:DUF2007 domain-containing protein [Planctomycetota bacterium]